MEPTFDPGIFSIKSNMKGTFRPPPQRPPRHQQGEPFLKGPIPWAWLQRAAALRGRALAAALLIWREAGIQGVNPVMVCLGWAAELGIDYQAGRRGMNALESAGLIRVSRHEGRCLEVTIQEVRSGPLASKSAAAPGAVQKA